MQYRCGKRACPPAPWWDGDARRSTSPAHEHDAIHHREQRHHIQNIRRGQHRRHQRRAFAIRRSAGVWTVTKGLRPSACG